ncbi:MAG: cytochrome c [Chloroflexi bacterium AL-W]|nr:cytochrome c [Chloroflexi bacterium AL-N1]NOK66236.1 cytochrome c [Chloroflexi bacterium AL-N10]NOK73117.1 cytochrome c [Chloroflexi bacterium AL-N5]NOK80014.1 cytochrome c [Chloroflexi bacterium AL-W]NOK88130.1 cytochrome c [Chloroflexi bacterium AL-N15]
MFKRHALFIVIGSCAIALAACGGGESANVEVTEEMTAALADTSYSSRGDATAGEAVFQSQCSSCHYATEEVLIGPGMAGVFQPGGPTLPEGVDYGGTLHNGNLISEENVANWIREGGQGEIGVMSAIPLEDQEMADLMAYLRTLEK